MRCDKTATRRSSNLYCLKLRISFDSAANIINNFPQRSSHRHLDRSCIFHTYCKSKRFRSRTIFRSDTPIPFCSFFYNHRNISKSLYVIQYRWFCKQSLLYCSWRFYSRHSSFSFNRCCKCTSLTTYKGSRPPVNM